MTAFIPSRMGTKRIPRKNVRLFRGLAAVCHVVQEPRKSPHIEEKIVSTDDPGSISEALFLTDLNEGCQVALGS